jgi:hypothetical protein
MSKIITVSEDYPGRQLTDEEVEQILKLRDMRDEDIDTSDIPEIKAIPKNAVRGRFYRSPMITLTEDLRRYFSELAMRKGVPVNDLVNETLEKAIAVAEVAK